MEKVLFELVLDTEKLNAVAKEAAKELEALKKEHKELKDAGKQNTVEYQKLSNEISRNKKILKDTTKTIQDNTRAQKDQSGSILDLRNKLKIATEERNKMSAAERDGSAKGRELTRTVRALNEELKKQERIVGDNRRNVGNYADVLKQGAIRVKDFALQMFGWVAIIATVTRAISSAIKITIQYEKELSTLQSITGSTREEMEFFAEASIDIGKATKTAATEVVKAFTLIGSAQPELLKNSEALAEVTKQALILAKAGGIDTVTAARALTSAMNQFGASAEEAAKFTDIFATSQQKGSSFINDTSLALENSGAAADAAGQSFETTNAAIQALAKGALLGARAGTALRGVLSKLSSQSDDKINPSMVGLGATIEELAKRNLTLKEAIKLVGLESATGLLTLIKQKDIFFELENSLNDVGNAQEQMRINTANVAGELDELGNEWEEFVLQVSEGNGALTVGIKTMRGMLAAVKQLLTASKDLSEQTPLTAAERKKYNEKLIESLEASGQVVTEELKLALAYKVTEESIREINESVKELSEQTLTGADAVSFAVQKWREAKVAAKELAEEQEKNIEVEKAREFTIGELKKQIVELRKAQLDLIPSSKELAANEAEILRIETLLGKENKERIRALKIAKKEAEELEKKALRLKKLMADAEVAIITDKEARLEAIEMLRFERLKAGLIEEFGLTKDTKTLIEQLEIAHQINLEKIAVDAAKRLSDANLKEINRKKAEDEKEAREAKKATDLKSANQQLAQETAVNAAQDISNALFENSNLNREREFAASLESVNKKVEAEKTVLDNQLTNGLITQEAFNSAVEILNQKQAQEETKLRKQSFEEQKRADLLQIGINGALAIVKAIAIFGPPPSPPGIAAIASAIVTTGIQAAFVKGRKFKRGGISHQHIVEGRGHPQGGVDYVGEDGHSFNVERDELITIVNKDSTKTIQGLSNLNQMDGNGVAFGGGGIASRNFGSLKYQDGGLASRRASATSKETEQFAEIIGEEISKLIIVASIDEILDAAATKLRIESRTKV